jgi:hypothetical protein
LPDAPPSSQPSGGEGGSGRSSGGDENHGLVLQPLRFILSLESCSDGIQNQNEAGVDCGGPCRACPSCSDGIWNQNEAGVDCGGVCEECNEFELAGRLLLPNEVKAGDEFVLQLVVRSNIDSNLTYLLVLPDSLYSVGNVSAGISVNANDSLNVSLVVRSLDDIPDGLYPVEIHLTTLPGNRVKISESLRVTQVSFVRNFEEKVFTFLENSIDFIAENPSTVLMSSSILIGVGYLYFRFRK